MTDLTIGDLIADVRRTAVAQGFHDERMNGALPDDARTLIRLAAFARTVGALLDEQRKRGEVTQQRIAAVLHTATALFTTQTYPHRTDSADLPFTLPNAHAAHCVRQMLHLIIEASEALDSYIKSDCTTLDLEELSDGVIVAGDLVADDPDAFIAALTGKLSKNRHRQRGYGRHDLTKGAAMSDTPTPSANAPAAPLPPSVSAEEQPLTKVFASTPLSSRKKRGGTPPTPLAQGEEKRAS